ncbi:hypothetical protein XENOCAPTIV_025838, partial [Xenoophorus captivus]
VQADFEFFRLQVEERERETEAELRKEFQEKLRAAENGLLEAKAEISATQEESLRLGKELENTMEQIQELSAKSPFFPSFYIILFFLFSCVFCYTALCLPIFTCPFGLYHTSLQDLEEELELDRKRVLEAEAVVKRAEEELAVAKERLLLQEDELQSRAGSRSVCLSKGGLQPG